MNTLTSTVSLLPGLRPSNPPSFRAYPRLTADKRAKTPLNRLNRAKNFSGGSRASIRGCARETATAPQRIATTRTNLRLLARLARSCAKKLFYFSCWPADDAAVTPTNGKSRLLTPFKKNSPKPLRHPHNLTRHPNLNLPVPPALTLTYGRQWTLIVAKSNLSKRRPSSLSLNTLRSPASDLRPPTAVFLRALRASVVDHRSLALTPCSQTKAIVGNCRLSKIRPKTYTLSLNTLYSLTPGRRSLTSDICPLPCSALFSAVQHYSALKFISSQWSRCSPC